LLCGNIVFHLKVIKSKYAGICGSCPDHWDWVRHLRVLGFIVLLAKRYKFKICSEVVEHWD
jgi:hypothetical protein